MLNFANKSILLSVIMLSVVILSVVVMNVLAPLAYQTKRVNLKNDRQFYIFTADENVLSYKKSVFSN
jgi:hypothetical protein